MTSPAPSASLADRQLAAREALDAWVREVVAWHFDPATGTPFWLERAKKLSFDPRRDLYVRRALQRIGA